MEVDEISFQSLPETFTPYSSTDRYIKPSKRNVSNKWKSPKHITGAKIPNPQHSHINSVQSKDRRTNCRGWIISSCSVYSTHYWNHTITTKIHHHHTTKWPSFERPKGIVLCKLPNDKGTWSRPYDSPSVNPTKRSPSSVWGAWISRKV